MNKRLSKILNGILKILPIISIIIFAYSLTPKTFQNDTFYTIKIGEHIVQNTDNIADLLPWNKGLDMQDPFSWHDNLPYTYPHWLYDVTTYGIYNLGGFKGIYLVTCALSIILGLTIYFVNVKINKNNIISYAITIASMFCLKNFIAARAQLLTFILFVFTIYGIEQFLKTKKVRYAILLILIPIIIANVHSAVWPFYFVLYLPYIAEYIINLLLTTDYGIFIRKLSLCFKSKIGKNKLTKNQINIQKLEIKQLEQKHHEKLTRKEENTYKIKNEKLTNIKGLVLILIICIFTGLFTPIKDTPYTYLIKTNQGNTTQNINEHLPLTLVKNKNMITILILLIGILTFSKTKIRIRELLMLVGLIILSFMSQRQVSMLILIGNFIMVRLLCELSENSKKFLKLDNKKINYVLVELVSILIIFCISGLLSTKYYQEKRNDEYIDEISYPISAANYIINDLIPEVGIQNLKLYNEYNYGSYLLFNGIPVFIDSRADLYTPEFNGEKDENGNYNGRDIFTDFLDISSLGTDYNYQFNKYGVSHVITYSNSKLNSIIEKDKDYKLLYNDDDFVIYERKNKDLQEESQ